MEKIIKKDGKIYLIEKDLSYGVWHTKETIIGVYDEKPKEAKTKKTKKEDN